MREEKAITAKDKIPKTEDMIVPYFLIKSKVLLRGYIGGGIDGIGEMARVKISVGEGRKEGVVKGEGECLGVGEGVIFGDGESLIGEGVTEGMIMGVEVGVACGGLVKLGVGEGEMEGVGVNCGGIIKVGVGVGVVFVGEGVGVGVGVG